MVEVNNERRFCELAWPHMDAVLRTAQCLTRSSADAEDLAQETMFKAFKAIHTIRDAACAKVWLMSILRRARIDQVRANRHEVIWNPLELELELEDIRAEAPSVRLGHKSDAALDSLDDEDVVRALRELPREIRWTLLLVDVEGTDQRDAAIVLGVPVGTVKSRLHRGRAMLRQSLNLGEVGIDRTVRFSRSSTLVAVT